MSTMENERQGLMSERVYRDFVKKNRGELQKINQATKSQKMSGDGEMMFQGGMSSQELAHCTKTDQDPMKYLKKRKDKYGY
jgi:hypothetical protein